MEKTKGRVLDSNPDSATFELWGWKTYALNQFSLSTGWGPRLPCELSGNEIHKGLTVPGT